MIQSRRCITVAYNTTTNIIIVVVIIVINAI